MGWCVSSGTGGARAGGIRVDVVKVYASVGIYLYTHLWYFLCIDLLRFSSKIRHLIGLLPPPLSDIKKPQSVHSYRSNWMIRCVLVLCGRRD